MSILNWLVVFVLTIKIYPNCNILFGILALVGVLFAHLGTNLFDDCIDYLLKIPKQKCKTEYLETGFTNIKTVFAVTIFYFIIAGLIGLYFFLTFGMPILYLTLAASLIILLYPKLNNFALGELAVGLTFGVLLFAGVSFVMTGNFSLISIYISIPVSLLTVGVVYTHALMDFDFDKESGKFTLCLLLKTKENALIGLMAIYILTIILTAILVYLKILPIFSALIIVLLPLIFDLYRKLKKYISEDEHENQEFMTIFLTSRNISLIYNLVIILAFLTAR